METTLRYATPCIGVLGDLLYLKICAPIFESLVHFCYGNNAPLRYALYWSSREADYASLELQ